MALAEMQHAADSKHCRRCGAPYVYDAVYLGHLGRYHCANCGATRPEPQVGAHDIVLEGVRGARFTLRTPAGRARVELPLPGLYNVYNALGAAALALALGAALDDVAAGLHAVAPAFGRAETLRVGGRELSILLVKNPAGANEVLRTLALEDGEHDLLAVLNDNIADGRDVSWVWDADFEVLAPRVRRATCSGTRAAELALRLKYAGVPVDRIAVEPDLGAGLDRALRGGDGRLFALPTYTAMLELRDLLVAPAARPAELVRMTEVLWHDIECGGYDLDLPLWRELAAREGAPGARRRRGHRPRGARPRAPRPRGRRARPSSAELLAALRERGAGLAVSTVAPTRATSPSIAASRSSSCRCRRSSCSAAPTAARASCAARASTWRPAGCSRSRSPTRWRPSTPSTTSPRRPTCARSTASSTPAGPIAVRDLGDRAAIERVREIVRPDGTPRRSATTSSSSTASTPEELEAEAGAAGLRAQAPRARSRRRRVRRLDGGDAPWLSARCASARSTPTS